MNPISFLNVIVPNLGREMGNDDLCLIKFDGDNDEESRYLIPPRPDDHQPGEPDVIKGSGKPARLPQAQIDAMALKIVRETVLAFGVGADTLLDSDGSLWTQEMDCDELLDAWGRNGWTSEGKLLHPRDAKADLAALNKAIRAIRDRAVKAMRQAGLAAIGLGGRGRKTPVGQKTPITIVQI